MTTRSSNGHFLPSISWIIFVTLACEDNNVAGLCVFNAPADGFAAVGEFQYICRRSLQGRP